MYPSGYQHAGSGMYVLDGSIGREMSKAGPERPRRKRSNSLMWLADEKKELGKDDEVDKMPCGQRQQTISI